MIRLFRLKRFSLPRPIRLCGHEAAIAERRSDEQIGAETVHDRSGMYRQDIGNHGWEIPQARTPTSESQGYSRSPVSRLRHRDQPALRFNPIFLKTDQAQIRSGRRPLRSKRVRWAASASPEVTGYRLYWAVGGGVGYDSEFAEMGLTTQVILPDDVAPFPLVAGPIEIGVTAVNEAGNESEMIRLPTLFDFTAPGPPEDLEAEDI